MLVGLLGIFEFSFSSLKFLTPSVWTIYSICKSTGGTYRPAGRLKCVSYSQNSASAGYVRLLKMKNKRS